MSKEEGKKEEIIKDSMTRIIKGSEAVAIQAVDSAAEILKAGLDKAETLSMRASDILLSTARRTISAGSILGNDARAAAKNMVKGTIQAASEIGGELKGIVSGAVKSSKSAGKSEEGTKSE